VDTTDPEILQRCLKRERQSRQQAEAALEQKSLELYRLNEKLRVANQRLEGQVEEEASARRQSETRAALIIDTALDAVVVMNGDGRIIGWNAQAARVFGYSSAEVSGKPLGELIIPPEDPCQHRLWLEQFIAGGEHATADRRIEIIAIDRQRHTFPAELSISRVESAGSVTFSAFIRDISERRQSEQRRGTLYEVSRVLAEANTVEEASSRILRAVCEGMGWEAGIAWEIGDANAAMRCAHCWSTTPAGASMAAASPSWSFTRGTGLPGRVWSAGKAAWITDISHDENFPRHQPAAASGLKTALAFPLRIGERVIGVMEFFAAQSRGLDAELLPLMEALGNQIGQFIQRRRAEAEADEARRQAEAASAAKSEFLAKMTHEIRTPLNGVIGMTELLSGTTLDEQQRRYLQISKSSAASLLSVINDILDFSKIEAGHMEIESLPFDPRSIVEDVIDSFTPQAMKKNLELGCVCDPATPAVAQGDSARLRQIVTNLIGNALKFTHVGRVLVRLLPERGADGRANAIRIEINDTGIGIPASKIDRLFKSFSQADASTTREYGGTGLGLAISKRLVELMGGQIGVRSRVGEGTTFWFTLAISTTAPTTTKVDRIQPDKLRKLRILAVDDNAAAREILSAILSQWARGAATVSSGAAGLAVLRQAKEAGEPYDVVLVDIRMPEMDGWQFASTVKADPELRATRLIAITGMDERLDRQALAEKGFDAFLTKPLKQSRLFDAIAASAFSGLSPASQPAEPELAPIPQAPAGVRVLVAEDNEINQYVARKLLATRGYTCDIVCNGRQAVEAVAKTKYNIVLMDCAMPEMDGFTATRAIRAAEAQTPGAKRLPIIALTAEAVRGDREKCRDAGMDEYVSKPIDPADLFDKIQRLILPPESALEIQGCPGFSAAKKNRDNPGFSDAPPPLDVAALLDRSLSDVDFAKETLERFRTRVDDDLVTIRQHVVNRAPAEVARLAHGLKGVAAHIGAASLREIAAKIESLGQSADLVQIEASLGELQQAIERCVKHIPAALEELTRTKTQEALARR
jgi:PAS domain S-box-containing protein